MTELLLTEIQRSSGMVKIAQIIDGDPAVKKNNVISIFNRV